MDNGPRAASLHGGLRKAFVDKRKTNGGRAVGLDKEQAEKQGTRELKDPEARFEEKAKNIITSSKRN
jgi:hypothetical protein